MTGSVLSPAEAQVVSVLLADAWGPGSEIRGAEKVSDRRHVVRVHVATGRSIIVKRRPKQDAEGFGVELAALEYLNAMAVPVAPRLVGADAAAGLLLMEDLGPGASLADALLAGDRERAQADLVAYARALGSMHAWSRPAGRTGRPAGPLRAAGPAGPVLAGRRRARPGGVPGRGGLAGFGRGRAGAEIDELSLILNGAGYTGLVHGDACPDNVRFLADGGRIFDFETSGWGPVVLDAAYLLAPFPSCWCFATLPAEAAAPAMEAYRAVVRGAGIELGPDWDAALTAALAAWIVARGPMITRVLREDRDWGTTTLRPRLLTWLQSFTAAARRTGVLPGLHALAGSLHDELSRRWPDTVTAGYPALARPGSARVGVPEWWRPGL